MPLNRNVVAGLCFLGIGALAVFVLIPTEVAQPPSVKYRALSPSFWPYIVGAAIGVIGVMLLTSEWLRHRKGGPETTADSAERIAITAPRFWRPIAAMILFAAVYFALEWLGFVLTTAIGLAALMLLAGERRPHVIGPVALLLPLMLHLFFTRAAQRPIPGGVLDPLLQLL